MLPRGEEGHRLGTKFSETLAKWELDGDGLNEGIFVYVPGTQDLRERESEGGWVHKYCPDTLWDIAKLY